ncbi:dihydrofolate reductase family protein [Agromyces sp. NPDC127015]|uniref:dihydrofolate reductase family protein n=1 Tax=Agromyces sp. NPDC127015 TaxID=3347108 RepID=UPI0036598E7F
MAKLITGALASLDGYIVDADGAFDWAMPSAEVHAFVNDLERPIGTYFYGRRMYEVMSAWERLADDPRISDVERDYASIWGDTDKIVYSSKLEQVTTARTRLERRFDADEVARLKAAAERDLSISGPHLAAEAVRAGLVDELFVFVFPVVVGGGTRLLPDGVRLDLQLLEERRFDEVVYLRYRLLA